jgi:hypothetical protein
MIWAGLAPTTGDFAVHVASRDQPQHVRFAIREHGLYFSARLRPWLAARAQALQQHPGDARAHRRTARAQVQHVMDEIRVAAVLEDVAGRARLDAFKHVALVAEHRDDHDVALAQRALCMADDFDAVHVGQAEVDE